MKNLMKVFSAVMLIAVLMTALCIPAMADAPSATDTATVTVNGIHRTGGIPPMVTLYKIIEGNYVDGGIAGYKVVDAIKNSSNNAYKDMGIPPTEAQISALAADIRSNGITLTQPEVSVEFIDGAVTGSATATVGAGTYLVLISGSDGRIYNPMVVSASYNSNGVLTGGTVSTSDNWVLNGQTIYAKSSEPNIDKTVSGTPDNTIPSPQGDFDNNEQTTASVGDTVTFTVKPDIPSYPPNAVNKTFYISDTMQTGLTFDGVGSIKLYGKVNGAAETELTLATYATSANYGNGFNLSFKYDQLIADKVTDLRVTYTATINDSAVIGSAGNTNEVKLYYATDSTSGNTYETLTQPPQTGENTVVKEDKTIVYTYELFLHKKGEGADASALAGATFGIYDSMGKLVDIVVTNANGHASTKRVSAGTYKVKELIAPPGYSLNTTEYSVEVKWTTATESFSTTTTRAEYTTDKTEAFGYDETTNPNPEQVGWLWNNVFYTSKPSDDAAPAYLKSASTTTTSGAVTVTNGAAGSGVAVEMNIPNTPLGELPSTGGIGTYLFTFGGIAIMVAAIVLLAKKRKRTE